MSRRTETIAPDYFEELYAGDGDPWKFATSDYEREKYAATLAALPMPFYPHALEVGCSIGVLTRELATRCGRLLAIDAAATPLDEAQRRCEPHAHVAFAQMFVPQDWPSGTFDLILLSEVVYYLHARDAETLADRTSASLAPGGHIVLVHWTGPTDYPLTGDEAAEIFISRLGDGYQIVTADKRPQYRLDILTRR